MPRALRTPLRTIATGTGVGALLAAAGAVVCGLSREDKADAIPGGVGGVDSMDGIDT